MCFSAQASFGASIALLAIGALSMYKNKQSSARLFVSIPLLFGIQQWCEGVVWITAENPLYNHYYTYALYGFLLFAYIIWPVFIPLALYVMEQVERKKRCLASFIGIGTVVSSGLLWLLIKQGATASISCNHIAYIINMPVVFHEWALFWYTMATVAPFFISSKKYMYIFGMVLLTSAIASLAVYYYYFTSVWCFFAALLSSIIYILV